MPLAVSVIIPVYKDDLSLNRCLKHLTLQSFALSEFEVIIVNNDPEKSPEILLEYSDILTIKLITEVQKGSYAARNAGIMLAKADIIAFTDADCMPHKEWIYQAFEAFTKSADIHLLGGAIQMITKEHPPTIISIYDQLFGLGNRNTEGNTTAVTANLFVRRMVFNDVGLFNPNLLSRGDAEWSSRAVHAGWKLAFLPTSVVSHYTRSTWKSKKIQTRRHVGGFYNRGELSISQIFLTIIKGPLPPVKVRSDIIQNKELSTPNKIRMYSLFWRLKLVKSAELVRLLIRNNPERE